MKNANTKQISVEYAQQKLIGSLIYKPDKIIEVLDKVNPDIFSTKEYSDIYKCIIALYQENKQINDATILDRACFYNYDISAEFVKKLANSTVFVTKKDLNSYINIIKEANAKKKTKEKLLSFLENSENANFSHTKFVEELSSLAINLTDTIKSEGTTSDVYIDNNELMSDIDFRIENPNHITGIPFPYTQMNEYLDGACEGEIITLSGESGSGKTYLALIMLLHMAKHLLNNKIDKKILFISLEMTKKQLQQRLISIISGIKNTHLRKPRLYFIENNIPETPENLEIYKKKILVATNYINTLPIVIDDSSELSADEIMAIAKKIQLKDGLACIYVDYVGLICNSEANSWDDIAVSYKKFKLLSKDTLAPIIVLNQYNNDVKDNRKEGYRPSIYNMTGGKEPRNATHKNIHIWKPDLHPEYVENHPEYKGKSVIINDKNREGDGFMPDLILDWCGGTMVEGCYNPSIISQVFNKE